MCRSGPDPCRRDGWAFCAQLLFQTEPSLGAVGAVSVRMGNTRWQAGFDPVPIKEVNPDEVKGCHGLPLGRRASHRRSPFHCGRLMPRAHHWQLYPNFWTNPSGSRHGRIVPELCVNLGDDG